MICNDILEALGHTPLVRLRRMVTSDMAEIGAFECGGRRVEMPAYYDVTASGRNVALSSDAVRPVWRREMLSDAP